MTPKRALIPLIVIALAACRHTESAATAPTPPATTAKKKKQAAPQPAAAVRAEPPRSDAYARPGFVVYEQDGRLWVFASGSDAHAEFLEHGEPAKSVTLIGAGPDGKTVKGAERATLDSYLAQHRFGRSGFEVYDQDGRLWVFASGSDAHAEFLQHGEPAKSVTLIGAGPDGRTVKGADRATLDAFLSASNS